VGGAAAPGAAGGRSEKHFCVFLMHQSRPKPFTRNHTSCPQNTLKTGLQQSRNEKNFQGKGRGAKGYDLPQARIEPRYATTPTHLLCYIAM